MGTLYTQEPAIFTLWPLGAYHHRSMAEAIRSVTVYCSSSSKVAPVFLDAARELGTAIAAQKWSLVYGGNNVGCMGALADAARGAGGRVIGVTPRLFVD